MENDTSNDFIRVFCRVRPIDEKGADNAESCIECRSPYVSFSNGIQAKQDFIFDSVFDESSKQECLFNEFGKDITDNCLKGYNGCIFAYGQTGSGKTHTILGPSGADGTLSSNVEDLGILPRTMDYIFEAIQLRETQENVHYSCSVSFMEIYNEKIRDLFSDDLEKKLNILST